MCKCFICVYAFLGLEYKQKTMLVTVCKKWIYTCIGVMFICFSLLFLCVFQAVFVTHDFGPASVHQLIYT